MNAKATFAHHDKIAEAPDGCVLLVAEPVSAQIMFDGHRVPLDVGTWLRKKFSAGAGGLWCEAALCGKVKTVVVNPEDFGALEIAP